MKRRDFIVALGGAAAWPFAAAGQQVPVIGVLGSASAATFASQMRALREGLALSGYVEGRSVTIEYRWADGRYDRLDDLAGDLVRRKVAAIATSGGAPAALAAKAATQTIPIVFVMASDPIRAGLVPSLNRPGGNITGISTLNQEVGQKRVELLREVVPSATAIAALINPTSPTGAVQTKEIVDAARALGLECHVLHATSEPDLEAAFARFTQLHASYLVISSDAFYISQTATLARLTERHRVPAIFQFREFPAAGGLMSYGTRLVEPYRQAGSYIARILNGEHPRDLPVQQATKVELVINLKMAKTLGLTVPITLLGRADEVIE